MDWGETEDYNVNITSSAGISENIHNNVSIFPNPVQNHLFLSADKNISRCQITNFTGQIIGEWETTQENKIDVSSLSRGVYFIESFSVKESLGRMKFIKN